MAIVILSLYGDPKEIKDRRSVKATNMIKSVPDLEEDVDTFQVDNFLVNIEFNDQTASLINLN